VFKYRLRVLLILIFGGCLMVATRLFCLQILQGDYWTNYAKQIRLNRRSLPTYRGRIYAGDGTLLAADLPAFDISMRLADLDSPEPDRRQPEFQRRLAEAFKVDGLRVQDRRDVRLKLVRSNDQWCVELSYSGTIRRLRRASPPLSFVWKGSYVNEAVSELRTVPIPEPMVDTAARLAEMTGQDIRVVLEAVRKTAEQELRGRAGRWDVCPVLADVPYDSVLKTSVLREDIQGFFPSDKLVRQYPHGDLAAHVIGYMTKVSPDDYRTYRTEYKGSRAKRLFMNDTVGAAGVEAKFNDLLRGSRGDELAEKDRFGRTVGVISRNDSNPGCDIHLSILPAQQRVAEEVLGDRTGAAVVIDVTNGEILVLASSPRYNPATLSNDYRRLVADPEKPFYQRAVKPYPLGSTFKVITSIAAWAKGIDTAAVHECSGAFRIGGLKCSATWGHGSIGFHEAMKKSCNVYFCELGCKAGADALAEWSLKMGLGELATPHELYGEDPGLVPSPARRAERGERWYLGDTANYSIGQGELLVTPLQAARAMALLCSNGRMVRPHVIRRIVDASGASLPLPHRDPESVQLPPGAAERIRRALAAVVNDQGGTALRAWQGWQKPYKAAGKTSTAQRRVLDPLTGSPRWDDVGWFVGFAPADKPRIAFAVVVEHLDHGIHGGDVAAPLARKIIEAFPDDFLTGNKSIAGTTKVQSNQ